jgi:PTH1 family peptidyl-tRNA hydrolase
MLLLAGLGNPGQKYAKTRHNVGALFLDYLLDEIDSEFRQAFKKAFHAFYQKLNFFDFQVCFLYPQTFMNVSGSSILSVSKFFKINSKFLIVVTDDLDQDFGKVRVRKGGGHGGHNGLRDMIEKLGKSDFYRMKIGIGKPRYSGETSSWVLSKFSSSELKELNEQIFPEAKIRLQNIFKEIKAESSKKGNQ